jgi:Uma2 family endonuclease
MPNLSHQDLSGDFCDILSLVIKAEKKGRVHAGANVSDRRTGWEDSYRVPDILVVLRNSGAIDCGTHWFGGPDFLLEIESPGDDSELKIPFYGKIGVRELLIVHRETRALRLYRQDGTDFVAVIPSLLRGQRWLLSEVMPLAFRRKIVRGKARTEVRRRDGKRGWWII